MQNSSAGWVDFVFTIPIALESGTYFLSIDSYDLSNSGPDSVWSQTEPEPQPGAFSNGEGWIFVDNWNNNSNRKPNVEKLFDYAFTISYK